MLWPVSPLLIYLRIWYSRLILKRPSLLALPPENLFNICLRLDCRGLLAVTQTCRSLYNITGSWYFWETLRSILESKPGIQQSLFEADNKKSLSDLKRYTWNTLRVHDAWLATSEPQFRFRTVKSPHLWKYTEVLPGGKWLFGIGNGDAFMVDLDSGTHHFLFETQHPEDPVYLSDFQLSIKEGFRSSFRVALFNSRCWRGHKSRICVYQVDYSTDSDPPFQSTLLTTIWDCDRRGWRNSVEVSDRCIIQCYSLWEDGRRAEILQLRRLAVDPSISQQFVERSIAESGSCKACLLPNDRLAVITIFSIEIYTINDSSNKAFPELLLLHRVAAELHPRTTSRPFVGHDGVYLVGVCNDEARRVKISHDPAIPPTAEILGPMESKCGLDKSYTRFGTLASVSYQDYHSIEISTYDLPSHYSGYRRLRLNIPEISNNKAIVTDLTGLDDNAGRIILRRTGTNCFSIMDLI